MDKKWDVLTGIRGLGAITIAFFFHYNHFVVAKLHPLYFFPVLNKLIDRGFMAVEVFFFISGITFMQIYSLKIWNWMYTGERFAVDRFSKLYPIHFFTLIVVTCLQGLRIILGLPQFKFITNDLYDFFLNLVMIHALGENNGAGFNWVAWTLSVNILLYFLFYWIIKKTSNDNEVLIASFGFFILGLYIIRNGGWFLFSRDVGRGLTTFFLGVSFSIICNKVGDIKSKKLVLILLIGLITVISIIHLFGADINNNDSLTATIYTGTLFPLALLLIIKIPLLSKLFSSKVLKLLGKISFSLFMIHYPIQLLLVTVEDYFGLGWDYSRLGFWVGYVLICLGCAYFCHRYIEVFFSSKIREFYKRRCVVKG